MVTVPRKKMHPLSSAEARAYIERVQSGEAPGNMKAFLKAASGVLTEEEGEAMLQRVETMCERVDHQ